MYPQATKFFDVLLLDVFIEKMRRIFSFKMGSPFGHKGTNTIKGLDPCSQFSQYIEKGLGRW